MTSIYPDILSMIVQKPKKNYNNSYVCCISLEKKRNPFTFVIEDAKIIRIEELNVPGESYIFIQSKKIYDYVCDINDKILNIVKENSSEWFNNNMSNDLIDDYYSSTLVYDKGYGQLLKLKIVGSEYPSLKTLDFSTIYDITVTLLQLRFYKQKFVLETTIDAYIESETLSVKENDDDTESEKDIIDVTNDSIEIEPDVFPDPEELEKIRGDLLKKYEIKLENLDKKISEKRDLELVKDDILKKRGELLELTDDREIIKMCEKLLSEEQ